MKKKGFTLAELLVVVGIIAVLVAIAIPVFGAQLEKSREAVDTANIRSAYAQLMVDIISSDSNDDEYVIDLKQTEDGWQNEEFITSLSSLATIIGVPEGNGTCKVYYDADEKTAVFDFEGSGSSSEDPDDPVTDPQPAHSIHPSSYTTFTKGVVLQDETGTCVIAQGMYSTQQAYEVNHMSISDLASSYPNDAVLFDPSNIVDSSYAGQLQSGMVYYNDSDSTYYYIVTVYQNEVLNGNWIALIQ